MSIRETRAALVQAPQNLAATKIVGFEIALATGVTWMLSRNLPLTLGAFCGGAALTFAIARSPDASKIAAVIFGVLWGAGAGALGALFGLNETNYLAVGGFVGLIVAGMHLMAFTAYSDMQATDKESVQ